MRSSLAEYKLPVTDLLTSGCQLPMINIILFCPLLQHFSLGIHWRSPLEAHSRTVFTDGGLGAIPNPTSTQCHRSPRFRIFCWKICILLKIHFGRR